MLLFWGRGGSGGGRVSDLVWSVRRGGEGGFGTAEDHESRKGLGAVSYCHAGEGIVSSFRRLRLETIKRVLPRRELASPASKAIVPVEVE